MATSLPEGNTLTPDQCRRLGAAYQLILSWRQENNDQQAGQAERPAQIVAPAHEPKTLVAAQISEV